MKHISPWIRDEHCCYRYVLGTDPLEIKNRVAFIEKTPRVRVKEMTDEDTDYKNWLCGWKGVGCSYDEDAEGALAYGFYPLSRNWCDVMLLMMGYDLPENLDLTVEELEAVSDTSLSEYGKEVKPCYGHTDLLIRNLKEGNVLL